MNLNRQFIAWDGEGIDIDGPGKPQAYVLFGASTVDGVHEYITYDGKTTLPFTVLAELIIKVGMEYPDAWHIGFGFDYDVNQIVRTLPYRYLEWLNKNGSVRYNNFIIKWRRGKQFTITKLSDKGNVSVTIYDIFSFFASSFVYALRSVFKGGYDDDIAFIESGKNLRSRFTHDSIQQTILPYWRREGVMLSRLAGYLRDVLYNADFPISQWFGPGAIASLVLKRYEIKNHMSECPKEVNDASQYAYAGGRFELFRIGRYEGKVWSMDINSAYPDAISKLPTLANGTWVHRTIERPFAEISYSEISPFALYRVTLVHPKYKYPFNSRVPPSPLFHRVSNGEMMFPWFTSGWYWSPEVENLCKKGEIAQSAYCHEVWEWRADSDVKPFAWIKDMYTQRQALKASGRPEQLALKLAMNSMYGKMAQRVGWEAKEAAPTWHQLEWAGWVTSYVRAQLFRVLWMLGSGTISVETDGIYSYTDPADMDIVVGTGLGEWTVEQYDEIIYLQSGTYFLRKGDEWINKYRGLDFGSITVDQAKEYLRNLPGRVYNGGL